MIYGSISGYYGGWVDELLMRIVDLFYSLPNLLVMLAFLLAIGRPGFWTMVTGYSLIQADSMEEAKSLLASHPHLQWVENVAIEVFECIEM